MKHSKSFVIIVAIIIMVLLAALGVFTLSMFSTDTRIALDTDRGSQAFFIAEGGLRYYVEQLQNQSSSWVSPPAAPANKALGNGTFTITTSNAQPNSIDVTSTATVLGLENEAIVRVISTRVTRSSLAPAAFGYLSRCNTNINFTNSTGAVTGDLSAGGNISGIPTVNLTLTGTKYPNSNVTFPTVSYSTYQALAQADTTATGINHVRSGNFTFLANTTYTGVWYISGGNITFQNGATLYGTVVNATANRTITMNNTTNVLIDPTQDPWHINSNHPAIVSAGTISATSSSGLTIKRLVYTERNANPSINLRFSANLNFTGTIVSRGSVDFRNMANLAMVYDPGIMSNPPPGFSGTSTVISTSNWNEVY
jgi:Tfp pilus assembly protein PilX